MQPLIDARRADPAGHDDFLGEFVNARMKDGRPLSDDDVVSLVTAMVFAGHETTAGQATWTLVHLMRHPEYHARLRAEVDAVLPTGTEIDAATLATLSHAHWAVAETSRLCPSVSMMFRQANQDMLVGGYRIPEGWVVLTSPPVAQRLPEIFPEPDRYDPYRFSPGRDEDHAHRFSIISFGGAIHKCTGINFANWEMAIIAALWTRTLDLELVTQSTVVVDDLGASRPSPTVVRYRRRRDVPGQNSAHGAKTSGGCPFHGGRSVV